MNEIKIFENPAFGKIRTAGTSEEPLFCLADVCRVLELQVTPTKNRLKQDGVNLIKGVSKTTNQYGVTTEQEVMLVFISEQNLYRVIMRSDKPMAEPFQDWVCGEVLPTIRKTGSYGLPNFSNPAEAARAWAVQYEKALALKAKVEEDAHKVEFFDAVAESKTAIEMKAVANTLHFKNVGRNKLFAILREKKILMENNMPYQKYVDSGYFRTVEQKYATPDGEVRVSIKTIVYQKGVDFIRKMLKSMGCKEVEAA